MLNWLQNFPVYLRNRETVSAEQGGLFRGTGSPNSRTGKISFGSGTAPRPRKRGSLSTRVAIGQAPADEVEVAAFIGLQYYPVEQAGIAVLRLIELRDELQGEVRRAGPRSIPPCADLFERCGRQAVEHGAVGGNSSTWQHGTPQPIASQVSLRYQTGHAFKVRIVPTPDIRTMLTKRGFRAPPG